MSSRHPSFDVEYITSNQKAIMAEEKVQRQQNETLLQIGLKTGTTSSLFTERDSKTASEKPKDLSFGKKPPLSLVPPILIREVAKCMEDGAKKRSPYNWRVSKISAMQTLDKILRHTLDCIDGIDLTEDTKLSNLASAAADIAVYLDAQKYGSLVDDRPGKSL